jgi:hypothetical protein
MFSGRGTRLRIQRTAGYGVRVSQAFYEQLDDHRFRPTTRTRGPWGPDSQHGGPPSALLGRAIESVNERDDVIVARVVLDILRPVPLEEMEVTARIVRPGRKVELVEGSIRVGGDVLMRASAWRIHTEDRNVEPTKPTAPPPAPSEATAVPMLESGYEGYVESMEWRFVHGFFLEPGPAMAWLRMRYPLIMGEEPSPLTRVLIATDSASGISSELDFREWLFVNPDLSIYMSRMPRGEWVGIDAQTTIERHGVGLASGRIFDEERLLGHSLQSLFVAPLDHQGGNEPS